MISKDVRFVEPGGAILEKEVGESANTRSNAEEYTITGTAPNRDDSNGDGAEEDKRPVYDADGDTEIRSEIDIDALTHYPNVRRSTRIPRPPERFDSMLAMQFLIGRVNDPMTLSEALSEADSAD